MQKVGKTLQLAREERGLTVEDVARSTRIPRASIESIEQGVTHNLPPIVYVRGFVRAYAKELGLDPEKLCAQMSASEVQPSLDSPAAQSNVPHLPGGMGPGPYRIVFGDAPDHPMGILTSQLLFAVLAVGMLVAGWLMAGVGTGSEQTTAQENRSLPAIQDTVEGVTAYTQKSERTKRK